MKLNFTFTALLMMLLFAANVSAINPISPEAHEASGFSVQDYLDMDYKEFKTVTGKKWAIGDRLKYKATKKYLQYQIRSNRIEANEDFLAAAGGFQFKWGAFFLGFFLNILGLLLVVLFYGSPRKNALISWLIGFVIGSGSLGIFLRG